MKLRPVLVRLVAVVAGALSVHAGASWLFSEGEALTFKEARAYFTENRAALERVLAAVNACRPVRDGAAPYNRVWASGEFPEGLRCGRGDPAGVQRIVSTLKEADLLSVDYSVDEGGTGRIESASFLLHRSGLAVSGSTTEIVFHADPQPRGVVIEGSGNQGFYEERRALTAPPFRWFWRYDTT